MLKLIFSSLSIILVLFIELFPQQSSNFDVGDTWTFSVNEWNGTGNGSSDTVSFFISSKITKPNGHTYFNISPGALTNDLIRWDTNGVYFYDTLNQTEWLFFDYNLQVGSEDYPNSEHTNIAYLVPLVDSTHFLKIYKWIDTYIKVFSDSTRIMNFFYDTGLDDSYFITISPEFGFISKRMSSSSFNYDLDLIGCSLSGKVFGTLTNVQKNNEIKTFSLHQNFPNPFNPTTKIKYSVPVGAYCNTPLLNVLLKVYDILGNEVATLVNEEQPAGEYEVEFSAESGGSKLTSGIYFYVLNIGNKMLSKKMCLIK